MEYRILDIADSGKGTNGHIIIVKANPVNDSPGFEHLSKMFGKRYVNYCVHECSATEYFFFPFSEEKIIELLRIARESDSTDFYFWNPQMSDFFYSEYLGIEGEKRKVHRHRSFRKYDYHSIVKSGIDVIVKYFKNNAQYKLTQPNNTIQIKKELLFDNSTYTGQAYSRDGEFIPHGYGEKTFKEENNMKVASFFIDGKMGNVAFFSYPKKYMYIGHVVDGEPNGWGLILSKGHYIFAYFKKGKIYKDLSPFVTKMRYELQYDMNYEHIEGSHNKFVLGTKPDDSYPFFGFQFLEDGSAFMGYSKPGHGYDITGRYLKFSIDGKVNIGYFTNGILDNTLPLEKFYEMEDPQNYGINRFKLDSDLLAKADSRLYLIFLMQQQYDLDMGPIRIISAVSTDYLKYKKGSFEFTNDNVEYFFFRIDDDIADVIQENSQNHKLWIVHLEDYGTKYTDFIDLSKHEVLNRPVHIHNSLVGLEYDSVLTFDTLVNKDRFFFLNCDQSVLCQSDNWQYRDFIKNESWNEDDQWEDMERNPNKDEVEPTV